MKIVEWLKLPEAKKIRDLDEASTTLLHARLIRNKPFLKRLYIDFYNRFRKSIPGNVGSMLIVELGSGGGLIKEVIPNAVTSDIVEVPGVDKCFSALDMPFDDNAVDAFFMFGVLHHISDLQVFFKEVARCLKAGGILCMIEPANTLWGRFIRKKFHHEPFDLSGGWALTQGGRLSSANVAVPWIIFYRDRPRFEKEFPSLRIKKLRPHTPFRYLASGGVSMRQLLPSFTYNIVRGIEMILSPLDRYLGMFLTIEIEKVS